MSETAKEEEFLTEKSAEYQNLIEDRLLAAYTRIRTSVRNGSSCFYRKRSICRIILTIPPQTQKFPEKKIIIDEHSGRILVDSVLADEEKKNGKIIF
jgi:hypothetical protein